MKLRAREGEWCHLKLGDSSKNPFSMMYSEILRCQGSKEVLEESPRDPKEVLRVLKLRFEMTPLYVHLINPPFVFYAFPPNYVFSQSASGHKSTKCIQLFEYIMYDMCSRWIRKSRKLCNK